MSIRRIVERLQPPRFVSQLSGQLLGQLLGQLVSVSQRIVAEGAEGAIVAAALAAFVILWLVYNTVAFAPIDVHYDSSEATVWAQQFAFGYKHPPMTAWVQGLWFTVFPRRDWAAYLLAVTNVAVGLAITWRLLRDHLDKYRALLGLAALIIVPLYTFKAALFNANTVLIPFWAATLLFYLRARRGLGVLDAGLAGAFASLTVLGKYWGLFLIVGMAAAAVSGPGTRRFWRSPAPYVMAAAAAIVIAPHVVWLVTERGGAAYKFMQGSVVSNDSFGTALGTSAHYLLGAVAWVTGPLIFLATLRPGRAALADIAWPEGDDRRQVLLLFAVPLVLPALLNLASPYRLTPDWTYPNWALLPIVLFATRYINVDARDVACGGLFALAMSLLAVIVSPVVAYVELTSNRNASRAHFRQVAEMAERFAGNPAELLWGSPDIVAGLPFYMPQARPLSADPSSAKGRTAIVAHGVTVVCTSDAVWCRKKSAALVEAGARTTTATFRRGFLGLSGKPMTFQFTVVRRGAWPFDAAGYWSYKTKLSPGTAPAYASR
jgi:4-amino-4-deoxy-L-arabinose transferase-like glycosyltransferase